MVSTVREKSVLILHSPAIGRILRIADLGCLEGGSTVEFARLGFQSLGIDVREPNIEACRYVQSKTALPNLTFARDDVWNIANYGSFDAVGSVADCSIISTGRRRFSMCYRALPNAF